MGLLNGRALSAVLAGALNAACATSAAMRPAVPQDDDSRKEDGPHKSYMVPVVEIVAMDAAVNLGGSATARTCHIRGDPAVDPP